MMLNATHRHSRLSPVRGRRSRVTGLLPVLTVLMLLVPTLNVFASDDMAERRTKIKPYELSPVAYYHWVMAASDVELALERVRIENQLASYDNVVSSTQLALVLSASRLANQESTLLATQILKAPHQPVLPWANQPDYAKFADLWLMVLNQRQSLRNLTDTQAVNQQQIAELKQQNKLLREKIEALTSIEQQLIKREQAQSVD